jgi:hypothetical protein
MSCPTVLATLVASVTLLLAATGCSNATTAPAPRTTADAWETTELAPGVELRVNAKASPGAREAADALRADYRSTYMNAR